MHKTFKPVLLALAICAPLAAPAEIIELTWSDQGRFERRMTVAPGKFAEVCGKLAKSDAVAWRFEASAPMNFNIHYHVGKDVHYPERRDALASASGELRVQIDQDYCWMWTNKSAQPVALQLQLQR